MENEKYPEMTVEKRDGQNHHNLRPPVKVGTDEYREQMQDTLVLAGFCESNDWPENVVSLLTKYSPVGALENIKNAIVIIEEMGYGGWKGVCDFVRDDECIEFFLALVKYCRKRFKVLPEKNIGFINAQGYGIYERHIDRAKRTLEQTFDQKYYFEAERPLETLFNQTGCDHSSIAQYIHPGHFRYPAGHGAKFYEAVDTVFDEFDIPKGDKVDLILAAYIAAMGRSGILVHLPEDNIASGLTADLPGFSDWINKSSDEPI